MPIVPPILDGADRTETSRNLASSLMEPAIFLAAVTGVCYALGHVGHLRDANRLGVPEHLIPPLATESKILFGSVHIIVFAMILMILYAIAVFVFQVKPPFKKWFDERVAMHRKFYYSLTTVATLVLLILSVVWLPKGRSWTFDDALLPKVTSLKIKADAIAPNAKNLKYLARRDGWFVLKVEGSRQIFVIKEDHVVYLEIEAVPSRARWNNLIN